MCKVHVHVHVQFKYVPWKINRSFHGWFIFIITEHCILPYDADDSIHWYQDHQSLTRDQGSQSDQTLSKNNCQVRSVTVPFRWDKTLIQLYNIISDTVSHRPLTKQGNKINKQLHVMMYIVHVIVTCLKCCKHFRVDQTVLSSFIESFLCS